MFIVNDLREVLRPKRSRGAIRRIRLIGDVTGITLHQTSTADFSPEHPKLSSLPAHALVHRDGSISLLHHVTSVIYHGHALNSSTIGIEVACRAAGVEGDLRTVWRTTKEKAAGLAAADVVREATDEQLYALEGLIRLYIQDVGALGGCIKALWAHRQGNKSRTWDPGSRIWSVAERVRDELGLADVRDETLGTGKPIPDDWR